MWRIIFYSVIQSLLLVGAQVFLKMAMMRMPAFGWNREFFTGFLTNWPFAVCGLFFALSSVLWMYIVKTFPFSTAYPMISLSYVFGMLAAILFFHESVSMAKWIGVACIVLGCFLIASPAAAQSNSQTQMRRQIQQAAAAMKTMQCDFVQTKHLKLLNDQMVSHGRMHYRQADQLRWEYTSPYTYTFILNKDKVLLKNERRSDVIDVAQNRVFREIARLMMNSIVGNSLADDKNFTTTIAAGNNEWVATLVSKKKDLKQMFQRIVLHIERQKKCVTTVELYEKNGDHTVILLKNIRINEPVSAQLFKVD